MDCEKVRKHFNAASRSEWERLDADEYHRLIYRLHLDFIKTELSAAPRIPDAGCGSGRYAVEFARRGCAVTLCDISDGELSFAADTNSKSTYRFDLLFHTRHHVKFRPRFEWELV